MERRKVLNRNVIERKKRDKIIKEYIEEIAEKKVDEKGE